MITNREARNGRFMVAGMCIATACLAAFSGRSVLDRVDSTIEQIAAANTQLVAANTQLCAANRQLAEMQSQLLEANRQLVATNGRLDVTQGHVARANDGILLTNHRAGVQRPRNAQRKQFRSERYRQRIPEVCPAEVRSHSRRARRHISAPLIPDFQHDAKSRLAAHHAVVTLGNSVQRKSLIHRPHAGPHAERQRVL